MQYNKDTFNQWWEFLKLSENYQSICELVSELREDATEFPLKRLLDELEKNEKFHKSIKKYMKLLAVYEKFGDVYHDDFEEWWEKYNQPKSVKTEMELHEYKEEKYRRLNALSEGDKLLQSYIEIWGKIIYFPDLYTRIQPYVNLNRPIRDIISDMRKYINKLKQDAEKNKREELDAWDEYVEILRLSLQEKYTINQIIEELAIKREKEAVNVERSYRKKKQTALEILSHVEEGRFP